MSLLPCCCFDSGFIYWCPTLEGHGAVPQLLLSDHFNEHDNYTIASDLNSISFSNLLFLFNSACSKEKFCWVVEERYISSLLLPCPFFLQNGIRWKKFHLINLSFLKKKKKWPPPSLSLHLFLCFWQSHKKWNTVPWKSIQVLLLTSLKLGFSYRFVWCFSLSWNRSYLDYKNSYSRLVCWDKV